MYMRVSWLGPSDVSFVDTWQIDVSATAVQGTVHIRTLVSLLSPFKWHLRRWGNRYDVVLTRSLVWGAIWLDRRSFSKQPDAKAATGWRGMSNNHTTGNWMLDISRSAGEVRDSALEYKPGGRIRQRATGRRGGRTADQANILSTELPLQDQDHDLVSEDPLQDEALFSDDTPRELDNFLDNLQPSDDPSVDNLPMDYVPGGWHDESDESDEDSEAHEEAEASDLPKQRLHYIEPHTSAAFARSPSCPIMQLSIRDIAFFQPNDSARRGSRPPNVYLHNPLYQKIEATSANWYYNSDNLSTFSRLSLTAYIPEIGIVLAGSPEGRVAVLSMTQTHSAGGAAPFYCMRLDWILPLRSQEVDGQRPERLLLGLAVSPVQGMLGRKPEEVKRWRVLLTYEGHHMLAYEIARPKSKDDKKRTDILVV